MKKGDLYQFNSSPPTEDFAVLYILHEFNKTFKVKNYTYWARMIKCTKRAIKEDSKLYTDIFREKIIVQKR